MKLSSSKTAVVLSALVVGVLAFTILSSVMGFTWGIFLTGLMAVSSFGWVVATHRSVPNGLQNLNESSVKSGAVRCEKEASQLKKEFKSLIDKSKQVQQNTYLILNKHSKIDIKSLKKSFAQNPEKCMIFKDPLGNSYLHLAAQNKQFLVIKWLINQGWPLNGTNKEGLTPLMISIMKNDTQSVEFFLHNDASLKKSIRSNPDPKLEGKNALELAKMLDADKQLDWKILSLITKVAQANGFAPSMRS